MPTRAWAVIALGTAILVAGIWLILAERAPAWLPAWDAEMRLVVGLGLAAGGFCVAALGGLAGMTGLQSMGGRLERDRRYLHGPSLVFSLLLAGAGGLAGWYPGAADWVPVLRRVRPEHRRWLGGGAIGVAALAALALGRRRAPAPKAPPDRGPPPGDYGM